jgi:rhamnosyltransferase
VRLHDYSDVLAVVVAYNPAPSIERLCRTLIADGCKVLIVDNASTTGLDAVDACKAAGADILRMAENVGVSGALVAAHARAGGLRWLLTFDQDSVVEAGFVGALRSSSATREDHVAMVGPQVVDEHGGAHLQGDSAHSASYHVPLIFTSGALCRVSALDDIGGFRSDLFIDHVDHDVCLRLRRRGWLIAIEPAARMRHSIGAMRTHRVAGAFGIRNSHHSPERQYYKYRNYVLLVMDGTARTDRRWELRAGLALAWGPLKIVAFEEDKRAKLGAVAAGVCDGLRGRTGRRSGRPLSEGATDPRVY